MNELSDSDRVDVLVVGGGPSGAVVAHEMSRNGFSVVCLEQGRWVNSDEFPGAKPEWELLSHQRWNHDPNVRGFAEDYPLAVDDSDLNPVMIGGVGGSSLFYGGHWMRLLPSDFRMYSLDGAGDDWPLSYDDLAPYYEKVDAAVGVAGLEGDPMYPPGPEPPLPPHPIGKVGRRAAKGMNELGWHWWPSPNAIASQRWGPLARCVRFGTCETGCPEGAKASFDITHWPAAINQGVHLRTHCRVRRITTDSRGRADGAVYFDEDGVERQQKARLVVLAANGIGTPRLLLLSAHSGAPDGLANSSGLVGKRLMLHPNGEVTGIYDEPMDSWLGPAGQSVHSLEFYETDASRGFVGGAKWQVMPTGGPLSALSLHDRVAFDEQWGPAVHDRMAETLGRSLQWAINSQDMPEESNAVELDDTLTDSDGIPAPRIRYRISENTLRLMTFNLDRVEEAHRDHRRDGTADRGAPGSQRAVAGDGVVTSLSAPQRDLLLAVADVLIPASATMPSLRTADPTGGWLERACLARRDVLVDLADALDRLAGEDDLDAALRELRADDRAVFDVIANVVAGAYYLIPEIRTLLGYPGQVRSPAPLDLASDELSDEVFDGAMNYSGTYRSAPA